MQKALFKVILNFLFGVLVFYSGMLITIYLSQRSMMYFPDTRKPELSWVKNLGISEITVQTADNLQISGLLVPSETESAPLIIYFHGNALSHGSRIQKARRYTVQGYDVLLAGYRGYGGNPGKITERNLYKDGRAYANWALRNYEGRPIFVYGESLGSGIAVQLASEFDLSGIILEAPFSSTVDIARERFWFLPVDLMMKDQYKSSDKIKDVREPLLIVHGQRDHIVPYKFGRKLFDAANQPKRFESIPGAGHNNLYMYPETVESITQFLKENTASF